MDKIAVKPARAGMTLAHPNGSVLPDDVKTGERWPEWPADQFTFRRLRDGDIVRVSDAPSENTLQPDTPAIRQIKGS